MMGSSGTSLCVHWFLPVKNGRFYFACSCDLARVVAIFGHKSLFSLDFTSKNGRFYFACTCDILPRVVRLYMRQPKRVYMRPPDRSCGP